MALVIKSWKLKSDAGPGESHVEIIARKPGLASFILSLLGIDSTTSFQVSARHVFYEAGSLAGFIRRFTPLEHVSSTYYGLYKPWKTTSFLIAASIALGSVFMGHGTGMTVLGTLILFGGIGLSLVYYFLNKQLSIGFVEDSGFSAGLVFKRSVIEGQQIDERATESVIRVIEHLVKPTGSGPLPAEVLGSAAKSGAMSSPAPQSFSELGRNLGMSKAASPAASPGRCAKCGAAVVAGSRFCDGCGATLPISG